MESPMAVPSHIFMIRSCCSDLSSNWSSDQFTESAYQKQVVRLVNAQKLRPYDVCNRHTRSYAVWSVTARPATAAGLATHLNILEI